MRCDLVATFADGLAPDVVLHVATDGDDLNGDGSAGNPFASIQRAAAGADPGTAIRVHAGTYQGDQFIEDLPGTAADPIWIGGAPGEPVPVLFGGGDVGLRIAGASYVVLHDLAVQHMTDNGVTIDDRGERDNPSAAHHVVVRNLRVRDIGGDGNQDCLALSGVNDFVVMDSRFELCGGDGEGSGVDIVGGRRGLVVRSHFEALYGSGVQARGGSQDIEIRWNRLRDTGARAIGMGGQTSFDLFRPPVSDSTPNAEARDIRALANVVEGADTPVAFAGCVDCLAAHNTIVDPGQFLLAILQETTTAPPYTFEAARDGRFVDNLVHFARGAIVEDVSIGAGTLPATFAFSHNLWYAHDAPGQSAPDLPVTETNAVVGEDPSFLPGGYTIDTNSPAAGAGVALPEIDGDIAGACYAAPPSIGAYEATAAR